MPRFWGVHVIGDLTARLMSLMVSYVGLRLTLRFLFKKNLNAAKPYEQSKGLGGNICHAQSDHA